MLNGDNDESLALNNDSAAELSTDTLLSVASSKVGSSEIALERRSEAIDSPTPEEHQDNQPITEFCNPASMLTSST